MTNGPPLPEHPGPPDDLVYTPLAELGGLADKVVRDAGSIPVAAV